MSMAICGSKRSYFDDFTSPPSSKRIRFSSSSSSPPRFSSPPTSALLDHLHSAFPHLDIEVLSMILEECGENLEAAKQRCLNSLEERLVSADKSAESHQGGFTNNADGVVAGEDQLASGKLPTSGAEWVELLVSEIFQGTSTDDAKVRASRVLEVLEKGIRERTLEEAGKGIQEENMALKQKIEELIQNNGLLKRAVAIQHERQKDYDETNRELQFLDQLASQVHERVRNLEMENYALGMQLRQAEQGSCIQGRFNPDVF